MKSRQQRYSTWPPSSSSSAFRSPAGEGRRSPADEGDADRDTTLGHQLTTDRRQTYCARRSAGSMRALKRSPGTQSRGMTACPRGWTVRIPLLPGAARGVGLDHGRSNCVLVESFNQRLARRLLPFGKGWDDNTQLLEPSFARILARNLRP